MNLADCPRADPLEPYLAFHRRTERALADLVRLAGRLDAGEMDAPASGQASGLLAFFDLLLPRHHEAEERSLVPRLEARIRVSGGSVRLRALRDELHADHRELEATWKRLRAPLLAVGEGVARRLSLELVQYYRAVQAVHISAEEAALHRALCGAPAGGLFQPRPHAVDERRHASFVRISRTGP